MQKHNVSYVKRLYRISIKDDKLVKANKGKFGGESALIRTLIRKYIKHGKENS